MHYLLYGTVKNITEVQFIDSFYRVDAHTVYEKNVILLDHIENGSTKVYRPWTIQSTNEKDAMIRMAGALACKICGYRGFTRLEYDSTDATMIRQLIPDKKKVAALRKKTEELLLPLKDSLILLTDSTLKYYPNERDENNHVHFTIPGNVVHSWVEEVIPYELAPKKMFVEKL